MSVTAHVPLNPARRNARNVNSRVAVRDDARSDAAAGGRRCRTSAFLGVEPLGVGRRDHDHLKVHPSQPVEQRIDPRLGRDGSWIGLVVHRRHDTSGRGTCRSRR